MSRSSYQGKLDLGWMMLNQALGLARGMGLFQGPGAVHPSENNMSAEMQRARTITAWGLFNLNL